MTTFPEGSAFEQADKQRTIDQQKIEERYKTQTRLDNFPEEPKPKGFGIEHDRVAKAEPSLPYAEIQDLHHDLDTALTLLEGGDVGPATQLIEEARNLLYSHLR